MAARLILTLLFLLVRLEPVNAAAKQNDEEANRRGFEFGGEYELISDNRNRFFLGERKQDNFLRLDQELQLRAKYRHNGWISVLVEGKILGESELYDGGHSRQSVFRLERGETWVRFEKLFAADVSLKVGRQTFEEPRRWWWDDDLDALQLRYRGDSWSYEFGIAREMAPLSTLESFIDPENENVIRVLGRLDWRYASNHALALFFLHQNDLSSTPSPGATLNRNREDSSDARLWWAGLRAIGMAPVNGYGEVFYWADTAIVAGKEKLLDFTSATDRKIRVDSRDRRKVLGWAIDLGTRWASPLPLDPLFTTGFALASGDRNPDRGRDQSFRQTGLQSNDEQFRTYGELLRPELSNLFIPVFAVEFPIFSKSHLEFAYRHFRQLYAVPFLRDARLQADPRGIKKNIGQEWMIYFGIKEWENAELELVGAAFRAGNAYGSSSGQKAYSLFLKMTYEF